MSQTEVVTEPVVFDLNQVLGLVDHLIRITHNRTGETESLEAKSILGGLEKKFGKVKALVSAGKTDKIRDIH